MAGDFNLLFDSKLDAQGGNPTLKKKSLAKPIELRTYDLLTYYLMTYAIY